LGAVGALVRCQIQITEYEGGWICQCFGAASASLRSWEAAFAIAKRKGKEKTEKMKTRITDMNRGWLLEVLRTRQ